MVLPVLDPWFLFPPFFCFLKFLVSFLEDGFFSSLELILGGDIPDGAVKADGVIVLDELADKTFCILERKGCTRPEAAALEGLMPALYLAVALRVIRRSPQMSHPAETNEHLEIPGDELGTVVGDNPGRLSREPLPGPLNYHLHISFSHRFTYVPVHHITAVTVKHTTEIIESAADVHIGDIHMPMLVGMQRLPEAFPLAGGFTVPFPHQPSFAQHPVNTAGTDCNYTPIQHHESKNPITLKRIPPAKINYGFLLPLLKPMVPGNPPVMLVDPTVPGSPLVVLARRHSKPTDKSPHRNLRAQ